ncbi:hypothetical protein ACQK5W_04925 [Pantoea sp. FN060301]|uniref:hypothetical protein n=1 Tax=Pantoea sp. FN060301 TaxID=3420380 RepID=UPI003D16B378
MKIVGNQKIATGSLINKDATLTIFCSGLAADSRCVVAFMLKNAVGLRQSQENRLSRIKPLLYL